jgi:glycosyltransferase involved in cell wall biosynthesis/2-polyprenyl-3-methyl-5-hydroxy-6-metoxy-1,4-benzoquinol methylase
MHACTIVACNYLAQARVLARSFLACHPGSTFHTLVLGPEADLPTGSEPFVVLTPDDLFTPEEWWPMWLAYSVMEVATAAKPRLLRHLLDRYGETATYLDPDIRLYRPMEWLEPLSAEHAAVLTPHTLHPVPADGRNPSDLYILLSGVYNLGFVSVGQKSRPLLDWWWRHLQRHCLVAPEQGVFVDQRWMDFAPALFDCHILKDVTVNVAYWNLGGRRLTADGPGYLVDGDPLTFFHFSGYDPRAPWLLSKHAGASPRALLGENPALRQLCDEYAAELFRAGFEKVAHLRVNQTTLPDGVVLDERSRRVFRQAVTAIGAAGEVEDVPNPGVDPAGLVEWLRRPGEPGYPHWLSRYLLRLYQDRPDVARAFPRVPGEDAPGYLGWVRTRARLEEGIPPELLPPEEAPLPGVSARPVGEGINVAGYLRAELGVGEAARQVIGAAQVAGVPLATFTYSATRSRQQHGFPEWHPVPGLLNPFDVNIVCVNADVIANFAAEVGPEFFANRYTVGYWAWELEEFPDSWPAAFDVVDEIWMNSEHAAAGVRQRTTKPVEVFPIPVVAGDPAPVDRRALGLPEGFLFLFMFDYRSVFERKNPVGLVRAFKEAFAPGEGPVLVLKSINEEGHLAQREQLLYEVAGRPDILLMEGYLSPGDKDALMAACDAYVSLHRSEGFGLTMAQAMALGKPTIATNYSGNLEFMNAENSFLVGFSWGQIPPGCAPYRPGAAWAEPDLHEAAEVMRRVYSDPAATRRVGEQAREEIARQHGPQARARLLGEHLARIRRERMHPASDEPAEPSEVVETRRQAIDAALRVGLFRSPRRRGPLRSLLAKAAYRMVGPYAKRSRAVDESLYGYVAALQERVDESLTEVQRRLETSDEHRRRREDGLSTRQGQLQAELRLAESLSRQVSTRVERIADEIWARPYLADPDSLTVRYRDGRAALGFGGQSAAERSDPYDNFRGPEDMIRDRQRLYVPLLAGHQPILEIGPGRGEFLDLAAAAGLDASGVDSDPAMVTRCREKGHRVVEGDGVAHLRALGDGTLGSVIALQLIEHLAPVEIPGFLELCAGRLRPGGLAVLETVNPHSLRAFKAFHTDITHTIPLYPEVLLALSQAAGFEEGLVVFPTGRGDLQSDLAGTGEYAVVLRKAGGDAEALVDLVGNCVAQVARPAER